MTTIRARYSGGVLRPLEDLALRENEEVIVMIVSSAGKDDPGWLNRTAGGWAGLLDAERLKKDIYESRRLSDRPVPHL